MKPIDLIVWGIERADGTLRSPVGIPLLWRHETAAAEFVGAGATERPVRLRITRAEEPAGKVEPFFRVVDAGDAGYSLLQWGDPAKPHKLGSVRLPTEIANRIVTAPADEPAAQPQPAPVSREEFEALRECVATLADITENMACQTKVNPCDIDRIGELIRSLAALRKGKEASDGN